MRKFSEGEIYALRDAEQSILISNIPEKNERGIHGNVIPGMRVYLKLEKEGLLYITEEDLIDEDDPDFGTWTPSLVLTDDGEKVIDALKANHEYY